MVAETTDMYLSTLTYLRYEELMKMEIPILNALLKIRIDKISKNPNEGLGGLGALSNILGGR